MYVRILQQTTLVAVKCSVVVYMVHMVQLGIHLCAWGGGGGSHTLETIRILGFPLLFLYLFIFLFFKKALPNVLFHSCDSRNIQGLWKGHY